jgi:hypothetical protein
MDTDKPMRNDVRPVLRFIAFICLWVSAVITIVTSSSVERLMIWLVAHVHLRDIQAACLILAGCAWILSTFKNRGPR